MIARSIAAATCPNSAWRSAGISLSVSTCALLKSITPPGIGDQERATTRQFVFDQTASPSVSEQ
jgi:hypothetical protein